MPIENKIEMLIEEAKMRLNTPEKIAKFKRRALSKTRQNNKIASDVAKGLGANLGGLGALGGATASIGGALPMSAVGASSPLMHAAIASAAGGLAGAALGAATPLAVNYASKKLKERAIDKRILKNLENK